MSPPCGRDDCPVAAPTTERLRRVRTQVEPAGTHLWRGIADRHRATTLVPGVGDTRFAPLPGVRHAYLSRSRTAALLESALHEAAPPAPTIYRAALARWRLAPVTLADDVRLADLRDPQLDRLGIARAGLVEPPGLHYPCTRRWSVALQGRRIGGHPVAGLVWHSRQADLHATAQGAGLAGDLLVHRTVEVLVLFSPPAPGRPLRAAGPGEPLLVDGRPARLVQELAALIGAPIL